MKTAMITTLFSVATPSMAFAPAFPTARTATSTELNLFDGFENPLDKVFEEEGPLGKGITVGKVQVAINVPGSERTSKDSIFAKLAQHARTDDTNSGYDDDYEDGYGDSKLSKMCHDVCLTLMRQSDSWTAACSESEWFKESDAGKAESLYNQWADREASKFEKEYIPEEDGAEVKEGAPTVAIVSLIVEIQGDETNFDRAGYSFADTKAVLSSLASDCRVEGGDCLNAVEVFWTPSEPTEVLTERDTIVDFPELITL
mmetsp:Transcript_9993/g.17082  ORF Transcript_9993/g.17082 Transcript_9993/m.17082 type:complete len:258 (-) Transcript_9993:168-941(-)